MPFFQVDDQLPQNPKVRALLESAIDGDFEGAAALSAWTLAGAQCQASLTDGQVKRTDLIRHFLNPDIADCLARRLIAVGLWHSAGHDCPQCPAVEDPAGWVFHDWFQVRYDSGAQVKESRRKRQELKDEGLLNALWARDCTDPADPTVARCRYCSRELRRADRKSPHRPMPDHVDPVVAKGIRNLVLACKECNMRKGRRTPSQAGMELQPPPRATPDDPTSSLNDSRPRPHSTQTAGQAAGAASQHRPGPLKVEDAGRVAGARSDTWSTSPPSGDAGAPEWARAAREDPPRRPSTDQKSDQIQNQSDPDLIRAGLVRARTHVRTAGSGEGSQAQGEAGARPPQAPRKSRRRRKRGKRSRAQEPQVTPVSGPQSWDAGDYPVEDPPGQFGSPWHGWRGRPPEIDEAFCDAHGQHEPCRHCQSEETA